MNADSPEAQTPDFWNGSGFEREWLAENRSGRLADSQTGKVSPQHVLVGSFVGLVFIGSVTILVSHPQPDSVWMAILEWGTVLAFGLGSAFLLIRYMRDVSARRVLSVDGWLAKSETDDGENAWYWFDVAEKTFRVSLRAFERIPIGGPVRIYFTPATKSVVNIEPLPGWAGGETHLAGDNPRVTPMAN